MEHQTLHKTQTTRGHGSRPQAKAADSSSGRHLLGLQPSIGHQAIQRLINSPYIQEKLNAPTTVQRKCALCQGDECEKCGSTQTRQSESSSPVVDGPLEQHEDEVEREPVSDAPPEATETAEAAPPPNLPAQESAGPPASPQSERVADAPAATYIVPFDHSPLAAPGERIIFSAEFTDPTPADYQLEYSTTGGHFTSATGPTTRTIAGLISGNVNFFVPTPWLGTGVQVVLKVKKISTNAVVHTETWNFGLKTRYPTTMTQLETTGERALPAAYHYDIGPPLLVARPPYYEHQTILERFSNWTLANIVPADIVGAYRTTHSLNNAAAISQHFLANYGGDNGTFTVNANDQIGDQHSGAPDVSNLVSKLVTPKDIEVALPQVYEAKPGTTLGSYTITRIRKTNGTWKVKKG